MWTCRKSQRSEYIKLWSTWSNIGWTLKRIQEQELARFEWKTWGEFMGPWMLTETGKVGQSSRCEVYTRTSTWSMWLTSLDCDRQSKKKSHSKSYRRYYWEHGRLAVLGSDGKTVRSLMDYRCLTFVTGGRQQKAEGEWWSMLGKVRTQRLGRRAV